MECLVSKFFIAFGEVLGKCEDQSATLRRQPLCPKHMCCTVRESPLLWHGGSATIQDTAWTSFRGSYSAVRSTPGKGRALLCTQCCNLSQNLFLSSATMECLVSKFFIAFGEALGKREDQSATLSRQGASSGHKFLATKGRSCPSFQSPEIPGTSLHISLSVPSICPGVGTDNSFRQGPFCKGLTAPGRGR
jgi:hypothetical protein